MNDLSAIGGGVLIEESNENRVTKVVIFTSQAYVQRDVHAEVSAGMNRLQIDVRAFNVDPDSTQARVFGSGEILGVQYKEVAVAQAYLPVVAHGFLLT